VTVNAASLTPRLVKHLADMRRLSFDMTTAEVVNGLQERGVRVLLLKGPVLEAWLYPDGRRSYGDIDLIVSPDNFGRAEVALADFGFGMCLAGARAAELNPHERSWRRGANVVVDLHRTLPVVTALPEAVWSLLRERATSLVIAGTDVDIPDTATNAFHVALHASQHGRKVAKPLEDLRRALACSDEHVWREAADIAGKLQSSGTFALGLSLLPAGAELARRLGLEERAPAEAHLRIQSAPSMSLVLLKLTEPIPTRERLALLGCKLKPSATIMRANYRLARRGKLGLFAAHALRPFRLGAHAPAALRAVRKARRATRDS
jgi:Uncharacterised nucleotidyltransferase